MMFVSDALFPFSRPVIFVMKLLVSFKPCLHPQIFPINIISCTSQSPPVSIDFASGSSYSI